MEKTDVILVTGSNGMVGSALLRLLKEQEFINVIGIDKYDCDLRNQDAVEYLFREIHPRYVFHIAAKVGGINANNSQSADFLYENLIMQSNVFDTAKRWHVKKLIFCGSACIYPKSAKIPIEEDSLLTAPLEETNKAYAIAKIAGVIACEMYRKQYDCNFISAMPTNLYGINDNFSLDDSHVIPAIIRKVYEAKITGKDSIEIWGTGKAKREFLFADDLADALIYLMQEYNQAKTINIGSGESVSIENLVKIIVEKIGFTGNIVYTKQLEGIDNRLLDISKINKLGWESKVTLNKGLDIVCNWFINNYNTCRK